MRLDLVFHSDRFNLCEVKAHFINPCCFGEDLARWLAGKLRELGATAGEPYQEDWGWEFRAEYGGGRYYVGVGGSAEGGAGGPNFGEWRVILSRRRSLLQALGGKGSLEAGDPLAALAGELLRREIDPAATAEPGA